MNQRSNKKSNIVRNLVLIAVVIAIASFFTYQVVNKPNHAQVGADSTITVNIQIPSRLSSGDSSNHILVKETKRRMKHPDSFEHVTTLSHQHGEDLVVTMRFREKNSFGMQTAHTVTAIIDRTGKITHYMKMD